MVENGWKFSTADVYNIGVKELNGDVISSLKYLTAAEIQCLTCQAFNLVAETSNSHGYSAKNVPWRVEYDPNYSVNTIAMHN